MGKQNNRNKAKLNATRIVCGIMAGLMVIGSIAVIIAVFL